LTPTLEPNRRVQRCFFSRTKKSVLQLPDFVVLIDFSAGSFVSDSPPGGLFTRPLSLSSSSSIPKGSEKSTRTRIKAFSPEMTRNDAKTAHGSMFWSRSCRRRRRRRLHWQCDVALALAIGIPYRARLLCAWRIPYRARLSGRGCAFRTEPSRRRDHVLYLGRLIPFYIAKRVAMCGHWCQHRQEGS
jgi:hypothetical protein